MPGLDQLKMLIKPTHRCNKNCTYCYDRIYRDHIKEDMSLDMVEKISRLASGTADNITWVWHGGEALMMGNDWLREAHRLIRKYNSVNRLSIQTNGILLTDETLDFLKEEGVGVGISYDCISHSRTRGDDSEKILLSVIKAKEKDSKNGTITVISEDNIDCLIESYNHLKENGINSASFNWVFGSEPGINPIVSIEHFTEKLKGFFDYWFYDKDGFDERINLAIIKTIMGSDKVICSFNKCVGQWISVNPIGDIYHCDRWYPEEYKFGNLKDYEFSFMDVFYHPNYIKMRKEHAEMRRKCFEECEIAEFCNGGCLANSVVSNGCMSQPDKNWCHLYKELFTHAFNRIKDLDDDAMTVINPVISKYLRSNGYRSLSFIKEIISESIVEEW